MYKVDEETLINCVKNNWKCSHTINGKSVVEDGWCSKCGCASKNYCMPVHCGEPIFAALDFTIFEYAHRRIWFEAALYKLGLLSDPAVEEQWQPVETAGDRKH